MFCGNFPTFMAVLYPVFSLVVPLNLLLLTRLDLDRGFDNQINSWFSWGELNRRCIRGMDESLHPTAYVDVIPFSYHYFSTGLANLC